MTQIFPDFLLIWFKSYLVMLWIEHFTILKLLTILWEQSISKQENLTTSSGALFCLVIPYLILPYPGIRQYTFILNFMAHLNPLFLSNIV